MAGGHTRGTLRNVQILRRGDPAESVDIYSFVLLGDRTKDHRFRTETSSCEAGRIRAAVGTVLRPAILQRLGGRDLGTLISMAGGPRLMPHPTRACRTDRPVRQTADYGRDILDLTSIPHPRAPAFDSTRIENSDVVTIHEILHLFQNRVVIVGMSLPGPFEFREGMRFRSHSAADSLKLTTFDEWATLYRALPNLRTSDRLQPAWPSGAILTKTFSSEMKIASLSIPSSSSIAQGFHLRGGDTRKLSAPR
jgi:hypothetical protein